MQMLLVCMMVACSAPSCPQERNFTGLNLVSVAAPPPVGIRRQAPPRKPPTRPSLVGLLASQQSNFISDFNQQNKFSFSGRNLSAAAHLELPRPLPAGMSGPYTRAADPFLLFDLSQPSPVRDYARWFYNATAQYLRLGGCQYHVAHVYIWNLESWDVQVGWKDDAPAAATGCRGAAIAAAAPSTAALRCCSEHCDAGTLPYLDHRRG